MRVSRDNVTAVQHNLDPTPVLSPLCYPEGWCAVELPASEDKKGQIHPLHVHNNSQQLPVNTDIVDNHPMCCGGKLEVIYYSGTYLL